jgi:thiamine-monophosphate kinase
MQSTTKKTGRGSSRGELDIIRQIRSSAAGAQGRRPKAGRTSLGRTSLERTTFGRLTLGIGDDCALLRPRAGEEFAVTTDLTIAGIHYRMDWHTPQSAGHRSLARGLSDLAAMGARPVAAFLSLGLPRELAHPEGRWAASWVARFLDGLLALAAAHDTPLAGGDLSETPTPLADIVLIGAVPAGNALLRSGARAGDLLYVSGSIGGGAASLAHLERLAREAGGGTEGLRPGQIPPDLAALVARHLAPQPRIAQGLRLRGLATAAIDLSDGLSTDLTHLCEESHVAAEIDPALLPVHPGAAPDFALHGGDDYELLFTARPGTRIPKKIAGVAITRIGKMLPARAGRTPVTVLGARGPKPLKPQGWEHFSR